MERLREQERIRSGKELLAAQKLEQDLQLKRNLEARRIEKEETARAKEKIRIKLGTTPAYKDSVACLDPLPLIQRKTMYPFAKSHSSSKPRLCPTLQVWEIPSIAAIECSR